MLKSIISVILLLSFTQVASAGKLSDRVKALESKVAALQAKTACNGATKYYTVNTGTAYSVRIITDSCGHVQNAYSIYNGGGDGDGDGGDGYYGGGGGGI